MSFYQLLCICLTLVISSCSGEVDQVDESLDDGGEMTHWGLPYKSVDGQCPDLEYQLKSAKVVLKNLEEGMLDDMCGDSENKVIVTSMGESAIRQPTRFGLYFLHGWNQHETDASDRYPSYYRPAAGQYLFFMKEIGAWEYWHTYDRWVIGPVHDKAMGGLMIKPYDPSHVCPYKIKWYRSHRWYHDVVPQPNLWNTAGNPWIIDDTITIEPYSEDLWPEFDCSCENLNITSSGRVLEYHPQRLGQYARLQDKTKEGYLAPVYAKISEGEPSYLYSHHPKGKVWLVGSSNSTWSLRLNKLTDPASSPSCFQEGQWEYLQSKKEQKEVWLKDTDLNIQCLN